MRMTDERKYQLFAHMRRMSLEEFCSVDFGSELYAEVLNGLEAESKYTNQLEAQVKRVKAQPDCTWILEDDWDNASWQGDCGATWNLDAGGPEENGMKFCPECGGNLIEQALEVDDG